MSSSAAPVMPDSTLWAVACHETFSQGTSIPPRQSSRRNPSSTMPTPTTMRPALPRRAAHPASERAPEAEAEADDEKPGEVRTDLVVEPRARCRLRAEVADVVVRGVERVGLGEIAEKDPDDEGDGCCEPAEGGDPDRHAWSVSDPLRVRSARISLYEIREDRGRPHVGALPSGRVDAPSRLTRRRLVARRRAPGAGSRRPRRVSSGRVSRTSRASSSRRTGRWRSTCCAGHGPAA